MTNKPTSKERELNQCPCCPATKCLMDEPCLGCETYAEWSAKPKGWGQPKRIWRGDDYII